MITATAAYPRGASGVFTADPLFEGKTRDNTAAWMVTRLGHDGRQRLLITRLDEGGGRNVQKQPGVQRQTLAGVREVKMMRQSIQFRDAGIRLRGEQAIGLKRRAMLDEPAEN